MRGDAKSREETKEKRASSGRGVTALFDQKVYRIMARRPRLLRETAHLS